MSLEIEAKFKVESHNAVRGTLQSLGAEPLGTVREINHLFDHADQQLQRRGYGLRVRRKISDAGGEQAILTVKGPRLAGELKVRPEREVTVGSATAAIDALQLLGYQATVVFEKRRESWRLEDCTIELDEVPILGCYVEIEGPDEPAVRRAQDALGLSTTPTITRSYAALLLTVCKPAGIDPGNIRFE